MRALALAAVLLVGCNDHSSLHPGQPAATYPAPLTRYQGLNAAEWGPLAQDRSPAVYIRAARALHELGSQGVPYLLAALEEQKDDSQAVCQMLDWLDGKLIHPADIHRLAPFLGEKYARSDEGMYCRVRGSALRVIQQAGPKARALLPEVRRLEGNQFLDGNARQAIESISR
jgi:hypothetical protein